MSMGHEGLLKLRTEVLAAVPQSVRDAFDAWERVHAEDLRPTSSAWVLLMDHPIRLAELGEWNPCEMLIRLAEIDSVGDGAR